MKFPDVKKNQSKLILFYIQRSKNKDKKKKKKETNFFLDIIIIK